MSDDRKKLLRLQSRRRGHLKAALRRHKNVFEMGTWFGIRRKDSLFTDEVETGSLVNWAAKFLTEPIGIHWSSAILNFPVKLKLDNFEQCGTTCCLAGLDYVRSGRNAKEQLEFYGLKSRSVFFAFEWPYALQSEYYDARTQGSLDGMVAATEKAIDYFAIKE